MTDVDPVHFEGRFQTWPDAARACSGYDAPAILERVRSAALKVKCGAAAFERDGVAFASPDWNFPFATALLRVALQCSPSFKVVDFGGSLGSLYFQYRHLLPASWNVTWSIVEQPHFVQCGRSELAGTELQFHSDLEEAIRDGHPDLVVASGVLPYVAEPLDIARRLVRLGSPWLLISRTFCTAGPEPLIKKEIVHEPIYEANYPLWILREDDIVSTVSPPYELDLGFDDFDRIPSDEGVIGSRGWLFRLPR